MPSGGPLCNKCRSGWPAERNTWCQLCSCALSLGEAGRHKFHSLAHQALAEELVLQTSIWSLTRLLGWIREVFSPTAHVEFLIENVLSMDTSARGEIPRELGIEPYALCPSDVLPYNRPRLAWVSQELQAGEDTWFETGGKGDKWPMISG